MNVYGSVVDIHFINQNYNGFNYTIENIKRVGFQRNIILSDAHACIITRDPNFDIDLYKCYYPELNNMTLLDLLTHYIQHRHIGLPNIKSTISFEGNPDVNNKVLNYPDLFNKYGLAIKNPFADVSFYKTHENIVFKDKIVSIHCYKLESIDSYFRQLIHTYSSDHHIIITFSKYHTNYNLIRDIMPSVTLLQIKNKGADIGSKLITMMYLLKENWPVKYCLFVHSKLDPIHRSNMLRPFINNHSSINALIDNNMDIIVPDYHNFNDCKNTKHMFNELRQLFEYMGVSDVKFDSTFLFNGTNTFVLSYRYIYSLKDHLHILYNHLNEGNDFDNMWYKKANKSNQTICQNYDKYINKNLIGNSWESRRRGGPCRRNNSYEHLFERIWLGYAKHYDFKHYIINNDPLSNLKSNVLSISHNFGGGTQTYIDNLNKLYKCNHEIVIKSDSELGVISNSVIGNKVTYTCDAMGLLPLITKQMIVMVHHLLYKNSNNHFTINKKLFRIVAQAPYHKLIFVVHDYFLLYPFNPNPIKYITDTLTPNCDDLGFANEVFGKCDLIVFNSYSCLNNYKKYINFDNYNYIVTNTPPDILTINYNIYPILKPAYNIGVIGHIFAEHKGMYLLRDISQLLGDTHQIKVFGCNVNDVRVGFYNTNVTLLGKYTNDMIFKLIDEQNIDFFMFVSVFEETYSFTLSIAMKTGLPIFYNDIGSYRERLYGRQNAYGFDSSNIGIIPQLIRQMETDVATNHNSTNIADTQFEIANNASDYNWALDVDNKWKFNVNTIEKYIIKNNVCFIHFTNVGKGYDILINQLDYIKSGGLYNKLDFIFITMLGPHIKLTNDPKCIVIYYSSNEHEWEFPTIKLIKSFSDNITKKVNILYVHTKGVLDKAYAKDWRAYLEYFLINKHEDCLYYLNNNRDCVGVNVNLHPLQGQNSKRCHFSGNFWWSNSDYIKTLPPMCEKLEQQDRYSAEHYIIGNYHSRHINIISLHNCTNNLYTNPVLSEQYNYDNIKNQVLTEYNHFNIANYKKTTCIYFISTIQFSEYRFVNQINELIASGLYDACDQMLCFVSGNNDAILSRLRALSKVQIIQTSSHEMEKHCLNNYKQYVNLETHNVVYFHTKGASHDIHNECINDWCKICNHFTIQLWKLNMILLKYFSCIGINLMSYPVPHFSGNFWWATGEHLSHLKEPIGDKYLDPEMYLLHKFDVKNAEAKIYQPNPLCLFKSIPNHAGSNYNEHLYKNLTIEDILNRIPQNYVYNNIWDNVMANITRITQN